MIDINLIPTNLRKKSKTPLFRCSIFNLPSEAIVGLVGGLIVLLGIIHFLLLGFIGKKIAQKKQLEKSWQEILPQKQKADRLVNEWRALQAKKSDIEKMTMSRRILWAPKLNSMSDSLSRGVWLNRINLDEGVLMIEGSVVSKMADEMGSVGSLTSNLKSKERFVSGLENIEVGPLQRRKIQTTEIADFSITAKVQ
mgnify:CR=1 FL=1